MKTNVRGLIIGTDGNAAADEVDDTARSRGIRKTGKQLLADKKKKARRPLNTLYPAAAAATNNNHLLFVHGSGGQSIMNAAAAAAASVVYANELRRARVGPVGVVGEADCGRSSLIGAAATAFSVSRLLYYTHATNARGRVLYTLTAYTCACVCALVLFLRSRSPAPRDEGRSWRAGRREGIICAPNGRGAVDDGGVVSLTTPRGRRRTSPLPHRRHIIITRVSLSLTLTHSLFLLVSSSFPSERFIFFHYYFFFFFNAFFFNTLRTQCVAPPTHFRFIAAVINATAPTLCGCCCSTSSRRRQ
uniref:Uncharacterized protein n=1 Tax=Sipha flava TaxID=143950 RepID=A0A2S2QCP5_9HEMI